MNKRLKLFLDELRSTNYKQTFRKLKDNTQDNCFCAEGVALKIYIENTKTKLHFKDDNICVFNADGSFNVTMPDHVYRWFGLKKYYNYNDKKNTIHHLNDGFRLTFEQIADIIEAEHESKP